VPVLIAVLKPAEGELGLARAPGQVLGEIGPDAPARRRKPRRGLKAREGNAPVLAAAEALGRVTGKYDQTKGVLAKLVRHRTTNPPAGGPALGD